MANLTYTFSQRQVFLLKDALVSLLSNSGSANLGGGEIRHWGENEVDDLLDEIKSNPNYKED